MKEKIISLICEELGLDDDKITEDSRFVEDLGCDSLDFIELLTAAEEQFDLPEFSEESLSELATVGDLISYCEKNL